MSFVIKTIKQHDLADIKKIKDILHKVFCGNTANNADALIQKLEEKGYVIGKKIKI